MSVGDIVRRASLSELKQLAGWFRVKHGLDITLLGGWAVYSHNPYVGSFDIDCLGPQDPFTLHLNQYMQTNGYSREPESPFGAASESWKKPVYEGDKLVDYIYIDACDFEFKNFFKEVPSKEIPYSLCAQKEWIERRQIGGEYFWTPRKELLFLYKTKAARDRQYSLVHDPPDSSQTERFRGKIDKDLSDMVSLLDPRIGRPLDGSIIGKIVGTYDISFIVETIRDLPNQASVREYASQKGTKISEIEQWVEKILAA